MRLVVFGVTTLFIKVKGKKQQRLGLFYLFITYFGGATENVGRARKKKKNKIKCNHSLNRATRKNP